MRRECPEVGEGHWKILDAEDSAILALRHEAGDGGVITLHNFADRPARVRLSLNEERGEHLIELLGGWEFEHVDHTETIECDPYGYRWYRICGPDWRTF
jgi:maltose alpha-D-glucosyltransferase/alpha-amylase